MTAPPPVVVFVCGVCVAGKTTVGKALACALKEQTHFLDADDLHPPQNLAKLRAGTPLDDADRLPWLEGVADAALAAAAAAAAGTSAPPPAAVVVVVACSALKRAYRDLLRRRVAGGRAEARFVLLAPDESALRARLAAGPPRPPGHALPEPLRLLPSQLATLERGGEDEWAAVVEGEAALAPPEEIARGLVARVVANVGVGVGG